MLKFLPLNEKVDIIKKYIEKSEISFCDISLGTKFMWRFDFVIEYAIHNDTLILKESCPDYKNAFYYPMGKDVLGALEVIEEYCKAKNIPLLFCCIDNKTAGVLTERYKNAKVKNDRNWSDYIYDAESFKSFTGKKYSGQRNHINKFKKTYPDYKVKIIEKKDIDKIREFLTFFEKENDFSSWSKREEEKVVLEYAENMFNLNSFGAYIDVENKIVAFSIGEIVGDTLIVHIEKGLREYEGVYPTMANEFAKLFAKDKVKYINREEDCGDMGLRISKLQYHPIEVKEKNLVLVDTLFPDFVPFIKTDRLEITKIEKEDKKNYYSLCIDDALNKYYGYDYREDLNGNPTEDYFFDFQNSLKEKKEEYPLAIKLNGVLIGELTFWNFGFRKDLEIGFRILNEFQNKGFGTEALLAGINYALNTLNAERVLARAFKENVKSISVLKKAGFKKYEESETHYFYKIEK